MTEYMHLVGAEEVSRAASNMRSAAEDMRAAANNMDSVLERHQRFLDDWLQRFEAALLRALPEEMK